MLILAVFWPTSACTDKAADSAASEVDSAVDTAVEDTGPAAPVATLSGVVVDASGAPWSDFVVTACREVCKLARTDASGAFVLTTPEGGWWSLELIADPADPRSGFATPLAPVDLTLDDTKTLSDPLVVPVLADVVELSTAGPVVLDGQELTADPAEWEAPAVTPSASPWLGAVAVDPATVGLPLEGLDAMPAAMWFVAPTGTHPSAPWPVRLPVPEGWSAGAGEVFVADYDQQAWISAGTVTEADGWLSGASLSTLGTVVLIPR